jgi:hypothetical protein
MNRLIFLIFCMDNEAIAVEQPKCNYQENATISINKDKCHVLFLTTHNCNKQPSDSNHSKISINTDKIPLVKNYKTKNLLKIFATKNTNYNPNLIKSHGISTCRTLDNFNLGLIYQPDKVILIGIGTDF